MRIVFSISLVFSVFFAFSQETDTVTGIKKFYYDNGYIASEGFMRNGKPDGYWKTFFESGQIKSEGNRKDYQLDSVWKFYKENGKLTLEINYKNNLKNGVKKTYFEDELLEEFFVNDVKQGLAKFYYLDGKIKKSIPYENGRENGISKEYDIKGEIVSLVEYRYGIVIFRENINRRDASGLKQGKWKFFQENGKVRLEGVYLNDKKNGFFKKYDVDGNLVEIKKYQNDELVEDVSEIKQLELITDYYSNGKIKTVGSFYNNVPEGVRRDYREDGTLESAYVFNNGIVTGKGDMDDFGFKQGFWTEYYETGELKAEGDYQTGKKIGPWKFYHKNGKIEQTGNFNPPDKSNGQWKWYYPSGRLLREETFENGLEEGLMVEYSETADTIAKGEYIEGEEDGLWKIAYGDQIEIGIFKEGRRNGIWKHYYSSGILNFQGIFIDDNPDGRHTWYYDNGNVKEEGNYSGYLKEGEWKTYTYEGTLFLVKYFKDGIEKKYDNVEVPFSLEK